MSFQAAMVTRYCVFEGDVMEKTTERKPVVLCPQKVRDILDRKACEIRIPVEDLPDGAVCRD